MMRRIKKYFPQSTLKKTYNVRNCIITIDRNLNRGVRCSGSVVTTMNFKFQYGCRRQEEKANMRGLLPLSFNISGVSARLQL